MSENERVLRKLFEAMETWDLDAAAEFFTPDCKIHFAGLSDFEGREQWKQMAGQFAAALGDFRLTFTYLVSQDDLVSGHWKWTATHTGDLMGVPATGRKIDTTGAGVYRFEDGKVAEEWVVDDMLTVMQQIGAVPAPA